MSCCYQKRNFHAYEMKFKFRWKINSYLNGFGHMNIGFCEKTASIWNILVFLTHDGGSWNKKKAIQRKKKKEISIFLWVLLILRFVILHHLWVKTFFMSKIWLLRVFAGEKISLRDWFFTNLKEIGEKEGKALNKFQHYCWQKAKI